jgi:hypothetical protein
MSVMVLLQNVDYEVAADFAYFIAMHAEIRDSNIHAQLQHHIV